MEANEEKSLKTESLAIDIPTSETENQLNLHNKKSHDGKQIDRLVVSLDMSYAVTYSESDNSISGWLIDIEKDGQQVVDVNYVRFNLDETYEISSFVLYERILLFYYKVNGGNKYRKL